MRDAFLERKWGQRMRFVSIIATVLIWTGCTTGTDFESQQQAVVIDVSPSSESAPGPDSHVIRLNRQVDGFDVLPSEANDALGNYFTAPCGWITLVIDGQPHNQPAYYWRRYASVTFKGVLREGQHTYYAILEPIFDDAVCRDDFPYTGSGLYVTGSLTVEVGPPQNKRYDHCNSCPAWCDVSHENHTNMMPKHGYKCSTNSRDITLPVKFQSQLAVDCSPNFLCGFAATNMLTAFLHNQTPDTDHLKDMATVVHGTECPTALSNVAQYQTAAISVGGAPLTDYYFVTFEEMKHALADGNPLVVCLDYPTLKQKYQCASWNGNHSVALVGYSETKGVWRVHDPLCTSSEDGAFVEIPSQQFRDAVTECANGSERSAVLVVR